MSILLPIYEFIITFDKEVSTVWMRGKKFSFGSLLLVSTRWCMVIFAVMVSLPAPTMKSCKAITITIEFLTCLGFAQVAVFSSLRISAIWEKSRLLFFVVLVLGLAPVVANVFDAAHFVYSVEEGACTVTAGLSDGTISTLELLARIPVVVADILVLVLTWIKTYEQVITLGGIGKATSVSNCLLRDGTLFFVILLVLNLLELIPNYRTDISFVTASIITIAPILVNRFMLNLRQFEGNKDVQTIGRFSQFSTSQFCAADIIFWNFGEPLEHGVANHDGEEEGLAIS